MIYKVLTVAGSDSGGCAGIQADIKTMSACGVFAMSAIAAVTSQNTLGVTYVEEMSVKSVKTQLEAIFTDMRPLAVKSGMLFSKDIIRAVAESFEEYGVEKFVLDPVMISSAGSKLLKDDACEALKKELVPMALIITPNIPEAEVLSGIKINSMEDVKKACKAIYELGAKNVVIKGGHFTGETSSDILYDGEKYSEFSSPRVKTKNTHGTGCSFSSAIASFLAKGKNEEEAVKAGKDYIYHAIKAGASIDAGGGGSGPVDHFYKFRISRESGF